MKEKNQNQNNIQIIRKDAKGCFVESLNDAFEIGRIHWFFAAYDVNKPEGQRYTNSVAIYLPIGEVLELCRQLNSGELKRRMKAEKEKQDKEVLYQSLGGTPAKKMRTPRDDGKSLSRTFKITVGDKCDIRLIAASGPGEENKQGLIVPKFGDKPENLVIVSMTFEALSELLLVSEMHYKVWLTGTYLQADRKEKEGNKDAKETETAEEVDYSEYADDDSDEYPDL